MEILYRTAKIIFLYLSKWLGLFRLFKSQTSQELRILCYHGFVLEDEERWLPAMFIKTETFRERLEYLEKEQFPVLKLEEALELLSENRLPPGATVITIDDGLCSIKFFAHDMLRQKAYPYTLYIASYYSLKETPIFNLVVQYMFWKTLEKEIHLQDLKGPFAGTVRLSEPEAKEQAIEQILDYGATQLNNDERCDFLEHLGRLLGVSYAHTRDSRILSVFTASEISELVSDGVDIQLHTHRHRWGGLGEEAAIKELVDNKSYLEPLVGEQLDHFCYPSGLWAPEQLPYLESMNIKSATTCESGLNPPSTPRLALKRFLDSENVSQIEFEAMMCGYLDAIKRFKFWR